MAKLPKGFEKLEPLSEKWALATQNERQKVRRESTTEELQAFYDAMMPRLEDALDKADEYPLGEMPEDVEQLFFMTLSLAEVAPHIELYGGNPEVPYSFEESRFVAVHGNDRG
ncbi:MAG: hypothetical protein RLQ26_08850 [Alphaproteobacteria bacterium]